VHRKEVQEVKDRAYKGDPHSETEGRGPCTIIQIMEIPHIREKEEFQSSPIIKEFLIPTQTRSCVESTNPCVSPQSEITFEDLSKELIVSKGGKISRNQSSGSSAQS
jgi:hypothetical protein